MKSNRTIRKGNLFSFMLYLYHVLCWLARLHLRIWLWLWIPNETKLLHSGVDVAWLGLLFGAKCKLAMLLYKYKASLCAWLQIWEVWTKPILQLSNLVWERRLLHERHGVKTSVASVLSWLLWMPGKDCSNQCFISVKGSAGPVFLVLLAGTKRYAGLRVLR